MLSNHKVLVQRLGYIHTYRRCRYRIKWRIVESGKTKLDAYIYHKSAVSINILDQRYLQLKVYLCLAEIIDCLVILMSSWQISSLLQGVASGNQSTLSNVSFTKHTSSNKNQVIQHLATKSPTNPLPTSSTVAEAASVAGTVFSCGLHLKKQRHVKRCWARLCKKHLSCWLLEFHFSKSMILICSRCRFCFCGNRIFGLDNMSACPKSM